MRRVATVIGTRIRELRERRGMSQRELAKALSVTASYVSLIESGKRHPRPRLIELFARSLECSVQYLHTGRDEGPTRDLELDLRFAELALRSSDAATAREQFADVERRAGEIGWTELRCEALWGRSRADEVLGRLESAIETMRELATASQLPGTLPRIRVMAALARAYREAGDLAVSIATAEEALRSISHESGAGIGDDDVIELMSTLVASYYDRDDLTPAYVIMRKVIADAESHGSPRARAAAYWNAALVADARGDVRTARAFAERSLALYSETDNSRATALLRLVSGSLLLRGDHPDHDQAGRFLRRALDDLPQVGSQVDVAYAETELARSEVLAGRPIEAATLASAALDRLGPGARLEAVRARAVLAAAHLAAGRAEEAIEGYALAARELERFGATREAARVWRELADALSGMGLLERANLAYRRAADAAGITGQPQPARYVATAALAAPLGQAR